MNPTSLVWHRPSRDSNSDFELLLIAPHAQLDNRAWQLTPDVAVELVQWQWWLTVHSGDDVAWTKPGTCGWPISDDTCEQQAVRDSAYGGSAWRQRGSHHADPPMHNRAGAQLRKDFFDD